MITEGHQLTWKIKFIGYWLRSRWRRGCISDIIRFFTLIRSCAFIKVDKVYLIRWLTTLFNRGTKTPEKGLHITLVFLANEIYRFTEKGFNFLQKNKKWILLKLKTSRYISSKENIFHFKMSNGFKKDLWFKLQINKTWSNLIQIWNTINLYKL